MANGEPPRAVDLHTHFVPPELVDFLEREGAAYQTRTIEDADGKRWFLINETARRPLNARLTDVGRRVEEMDALGVGVQALSPPPFAMYLEVERGAASAVTRLANDAITAAVRSRPGRFVGVATVPIQAPEEAARELERAVRTLDMRAVQIGTRVGQVQLDDPTLAPFWEAAVALQVPVLLHPFDAAPGGPLGRFNLGNLLGNPTDTALAAALLIFGGVLERLPKLRVVLYHAGGAFPAVLGRLDHGYRIQAGGRTAIPRPPSGYLDQLSFDTIAHDTTALNQLVDRFGARRFMIGSDFPFDMGLADPVGAVRTLDRPAAEADDILFGNARRLLGLSPPEVSARGS